MYHLQVLTPEVIFFDDMVEAIIAPGSEGYLGVLQNHASLMTTLKAGLFIITDKNKVKHTYRISSGFLEVDHNKVSVLVETVEPSSETIDIALSDEED